ncbi:hypothetical protein SHKM778_89240 [Streptomyces sp. KM77-8]|uniref:Uncharacterized protein n=1 Tax=Streptomyces haneummycinicus TaxID=3074435 RepID=A0AAT9HYK1_9ACTN
MRGRAERGRDHPGAPAGAGAASEARRTQIDQSITALRATRIESVNDYNSKAAQEHRAPFRDKDLPYRLDAAAEKTACTD